MNYAFVLDDLAQRIAVCTQRTDAQQDAGEGNRGDQDPAGVHSMLRRRQRGHL
jgi:hypothetical protein